MEGQTRKFQAAQAKAEQAAHEIQRQMTASYRRGYMDGSTDERQLMTDDLRNTLNSFSQKCETRAKTQESEFNAIQHQSIPEVAANDDEQEAGAFTRIAAKFAPAKDTNVADIQNDEDKLDDTTTKSGHRRKAT